MCIFLYFKESGVKSEFIIECGEDIELLFLMWFYNCNKLNNMCQNFIFLGI